MRSLLAFALSLVEGVGPSGVREAVVVGGARDSSRDWSGDAWRKFREKLKTSGFMGEEGWDPKSTS